MKFLIGISSLAFGFIVGTCLWDMLLRFLTNGEVELIKLYLFN